MLKGAMLKGTARRQVDVRVRTDADPAAMYALLAEGTSWPVWAPVASFRLEQPGDTAPEGVGAVRVFRVGWQVGPQAVCRQRVVECEPGRRFGYELVSGLPMRAYRGGVDFDPVPGGTVIRWHATFIPRIPGTGWLCALSLAWFIRRCALGLAAQASSPVAPPPRGERSPVHPVSLESFSTA